MNRNDCYTHLNRSIDRLRVFFPKNIHWKKRGIEKKRLDSEECSSDKKRYIEIERSELEAS